MITIIASQAVQDFASWNTVFQSAPAKAKRDQYGMQITGLYQSVQNPNEVTIIGQAPSVEQLQAMFNDPEQQALMQQSGTVGAPNLQVLKSVELAGAAR